MNTWPDFEQPAWLVLLPIVPVLIVWWLRRKPLALRFPDVAVPVRINSHRGKISRWCGAGGRGFALAAVVLALADPRWPDPGSRIPTEGIAILLVVDVSNSMNEEDFLWKDKTITRLKAVKQAFRLFIAGGTGPGGEELTGRPHDLVGLVTFTRLPKISCPLTLSHDTLLQILDQEDTGKGGHDFETNIADAIAMSVWRLNTSPVKQKVLVLVTDGEQGANAELKPRQTAQLAAHFGIPIMVIDVGNEAAKEGKTPAEEFAAENRRNAKKTMQDVAKMTSGQYYAAIDGKGLLQACGKVSTELDLLEREQIETARRRKYFDSYAWFGGGALLLWFAVVGLELTVFRRVP